MKWVVTFSIKKRRITYVKTEGDISTIAFRVDYNKNITC